MSYDLLVCVNRLDESDAETWNTLDDIKPTLEEQKALLEFRALLLSKFPAENEAGESADSWSVPPPAQIQGAGLLLNVGYNKASAILPELLALSRENQLALLDYQSSRIYRPDGFSGVTLEVEEKASYLAPTKKQIEEAVNSLTAKGGPSLLFMERGTEDYVQIAGGDGIYTLEWREYSSGAFKHFVAGTKVGNKTKEVQIKSNGFHMTVMENEKLGAAEAASLMTAFAAAQVRPNDVEWRDITGNFSS